MFGMFVGAMCATVGAGDVRSLPDPLMLSNGERVTTPQVWLEKRRPELLELFRTNVYGRNGVERPDSLRFEVKSVTPGMMGGKATRKQITISYDGPDGKGAFDLLLFVPSNAAKPSPAFLLICNRGVNNIDPSREKQSPFWPAEELIDRGYAAATFHNEEVDPDRPNGLEEGVRGIFKRPETGDAWGAIAAWAWGASRAMDYLVADPDVDAKRVAVIGHSRGGKAALWCGAQDDRFALTISNESGCSGAAIARGTKGETVEVINRKFPHWFCDNYKAFAGREDEMPVDQHELIALIAPRPVYVASAYEDGNAGPEQEFLACVQAEPAYRLFGLKGVGADRMPPVDTPLQQGAIGYHIRTGGHDLTLYDWQRYLDFADKHMR